MWQVSLASCGRSRSHAHHAATQSKGLSLKVSDEFTVPLALLTTTTSTPQARNESGGRSTIERLKIANGLWQQSREGYPAAGGAALPELPENGGGRGQSGTTQVRRYCCELPIKSIMPAARHKRPFNVSAPLALHP